jgi:tetratricopeptide (TPR) repeat protein
MDAKLPFTEQSLAARPDDPLPRLIEAKWAIHNKEMRKAREILLQIVEKHPHVLDAQAALGQILLESGTEEDFLAWHEQLPDDADEHPDIWFVRGLRFARLEQMDAAVRCFSEAVRRDTNHAAANHQLSSALAAIGKADQAEASAARARSSLAWPCYRRNHQHGQNAGGREPAARFGPLVGSCGRAMARLDWNRDERPGDLKFYQKI